MASFFRNELVFAVNFLQHCGSVCLLLSGMFMIRSLTSDRLGVGGNGVMTYFNFQFFICWKIICIPIARRVLIYWMTSYPDTSISSHIPFWLFFEFSICLSVPKVAELTTFCLVLFACSSSSSSIDSNW